VNIEEAFEDDVEDAAIHGIEKAGVEICVDVNKSFNILVSNNFPIYILSSNLPQYSKFLLYF
jgi:hypothetical protein